MTGMAPIRPWPTGALGELYRRVAMEIEALEPPAGTTRVERVVSVPLRGTNSINHLAPGTLAFSRAVEDLRGRSMRAMHRMHYLLPRPIPSVGDDGQKAPVWLHARMRFAKPAVRDLGNFGTLVEKAVFDGLVGPKWKGRPVKGEKRIPANRTIIYQGAAYTGGWLLDDTEHDILMWFDFDPQLGEPCLTLRFVWDQPLPGWQ